MTVLTDNKLKKTPPKRGFFLPKDLVSLSDLSKKQIELVLERALEYKNGRVIAAPLQGKTVFNLFFEPSTRTRVSFELAAKKLGAHVINFNSSDSSLKKGETLKDTILTLSAMKPDLFVVRHAESGAATSISQWTSIPVINAGDGRYQHPTQGLLDLFTAREFFGHLKGLRVAIVGDCNHSRVARTDLVGFKKMGAQVTLVGPPVLVSDYFKKLGAQVTHHFDSVLKESDLIIMLRLQKERLEKNLDINLDEYRKQYRLTAERAAKMKKGAAVMHQGPLNRDIEIESSVADGTHPKPLILGLVANGVPVRMAILEMWGHHIAL